MILPILQYGDPILRAKGKRIDEIDDHIRELAANMIETMHAAHGVGLAAQQIGEALQLTVLDISAVEDRPSTLNLGGTDVDPKTAMPLGLINTSGMAAFGSVSLPSSFSVLGRSSTAEISSTVSFNASPIC